MECREGKGKGRESECEGKQIGGKEIKWDREGGIPRGDRHWKGNECNGQSKGKENNGKEGKQREME